MRTRVSQFGFDERMAIRDRKAAGESAVALAREFGTNTATVHNFARHSAGKRGDTPLANKLYKPSLPTMSEAPEMVRCAPFAASLRRVACAARHLAGQNGDERYGACRRCPEGASRAAQ